jgi:hypothetical protein
MTISSKILSMETQIEEKPEQSEPTRPGNIYDVFVKNIFGRLLVFADFLLNYADTEFVDSIDLDKISSSPTHYVDPNGTERILDLVFSCPLKNHDNTKTMILFEHAGHTFADLPIRLHCYAISIWWSEIKEGKKILSAIYFIVLRTGMSPYRGSYPEIADRLPKDNNGQPLGFAPQLCYTVVDLPAIKMEDLRGGPMLRTAMGILKNMTEGTEEEYAQTMLSLTELGDELQQYIVTKDVLDFVAKVFAAHGKRLEAEEVRKAITPIFHERTEKMITTIFDEARAEGEAKGKAEGEVKFGRNAVLAALRKKFTKVPKHIETAIQQMNDPIVLESINVEVAVCQTLDEFADALK